VDTATVTPAQLYWSSTGHVRCQVHLEQVDAESRVAEGWRSIPDAKQGQRQVRYQCEQCQNGSPVARRNQSPVARGRTTAPAAAAVPERAATPAAAATPSGNPATLLDTPWRLRTRSGNTLRCDLHRTATGIDLRVTLQDTLLRSQCVPTIEAGRALSDTWRRTLLEGGAEESPQPTSAA
jgi:hypothetical protein